MKERAEVKRTIEISLDQYKEGTLSLPSRRRALLQMTAGTNSLHDLSSVNDSIENSQAGDEVQGAGKSKTFVTADQQKNPVKFAISKPVHVRR